MILKDIFTKYGEYERTNDDFFKIFPVDNIEEISKRSGINKRLICLKDSDAISLSKCLIDDKQLYNRIENQNLIIVVSECVTQIIPPPSSLILSEIDRFEGQVIDLNRGCSGFVEALIIANLYFISNMAEKVLIITADSYSKHFSLEKKSVSMIFGDCASLTFVEKSSNTTYFSDTVSKFSANRHISIIGSELNMNGAAVLSFVRSHVLPQIKKTIDFAILKDIVITRALVHQGSKLVVDEIRKKFGWKQDFCPFYIGDYGNTNSSTIPIGLKLIKDKDEFRSGNFLLSGFGVGLSSATILLALSVS